jgi:hypothetical protein
MIGDPPLKNFQLKLHIRFKPEPGESKAVVTRNRLHCCSNTFSLQLLCMHIIGRRHIELLVKIAREITL